MKKKGFATSAIMYTMLLLFLVLLVGILNNLQNKKTILDQLKADTVSALESDSQMDYLLGTIGEMNQKITELENMITQNKTSIANLEKNFYTKTEVNDLFYSHALKITSVNSQAELDKVLSIQEKCSASITVFEEVIDVNVSGLSLGPARWLVETSCLTKNSYGYQTAKKHVSGAGMTIMVRSLYNGVHTEWKTVSLS